MCAAKKNKAPTFEEALERLETIVKEMESGQSLDAMLQHFEEGSKLVKLCNKQLHEIEQKIEKLVQQGEAEKTEPFDAKEAT